MGRARNLANLLEADGDVKSGALDNVQSPLTAGTDYQTPLTAGTDYQTPLTAGTDYQTPLTAGTDYQTPLTAGTDYLEPDGDGSGLSGIASDALSKSFTVETGGSTTANNAVSVGGAGTVGKYPSPHTVGTAYDDTSETTESYWTISGNGKVGVHAEFTVPSNGTYRVTVSGIALPNDGDGTEGSTYTYDVGIIGNAIEYNYSQSSVAHLGTGNKFHIWLGAHTRHGGSQHINKSYHLVCSVDETTGNVTKIDENIIGESHSNSSLNRDIYLEVHDHATESVAWVWRAIGNGSYRYYYSTYQSGSWTGVATDTSTSPINNSGAVFYDTNKLSIIYGGDHYTLTKDGSNRWLSSDLSSSTNVLTNYSTGSSVYYPSSDRAVVYYEDGNGFFHLVVFDVSSSDGSLTETDDITFDKDTVLGGNNILHWFSKDKSNIGFTSSTTVTTFTINASGEIENFSPSLTFNTIKRIGYSDTDEITMHRFPVSNLTRTPITINKWSSDPFQLIGLANSSESAGSTVDVTVAGVKGGFTGLSVGKTYCINKTLLDGSIVLSDSTDAGESVGRAISSTEILVGDTA